ncbi:MULTISPECIES: FHA domain-containing protein [unclassified Nesterenkonia]|uniref:FHA domain-containing protein n=1 Tax=unclassified Nesterenkonia TaxID=2629769 RepID=UPI001C49CB16|nr:MULTISPECIES: FHA domain-containing protein [unclassified Nesterenkonia]
MRLDIDLAFNVTQVEPDGTSSEPINATITAAGRHIEVRTEDSSLLDGMPRSITRAADALATQLAAQDLTLSVIGPAGEIVSLGAVKTTMLSRALTRSKHIRLGSLKSLPRFAGSGSSEAQGSGSLIPPETPWPPAPTFNRRIRRRVTTTHAPRGAGRPRLVMSRTDQPGAGPLEFNLVADRTLIGSDESSDLLLAGLEPLHAEILHDEFDEFVIVRHGSIGGSRSAEPGAPVTLRTGSRIDLGIWRLVFLRAEYADHGRPYGGRQGGEYAYQKPQYDPYRQRS